MHYLCLLLLSFLLFSCQPSQPSEMEVYETNQAAAHQELETEFNQLIRQQVQTLNDESLAAKHFVVSSEAKTALKNSLTALQPVDNSKQETPSDLTQQPSDSSTIHTEEVPNTPTKINNGALLVNVRDYQDTYNKVHQLAAKYDFNVASEMEQTTNFHKGNTMQIQAAPKDFERLIKEFRNLAVIIRKKQIWQQKENNDFLQLQNEITTTHKQLTDLNAQLLTVTDLNEQLTIKDKIATVNSTLELAALTAKSTLKNESLSSITLSFYQHIDLVKPTPETFSADFSTNLVVGWANFKQFVLDAALIWPYIILALILFMTIALAVNSSRKKARQFKLQMLHSQNMQQQQIQQQIAQTQNKANKN